MRWRRLVAAGLLLIAAATHFSPLAAEDHPPPEIRVRLQANQTIRFVQDIVWETKQKAGKKQYSAEGTTHHDVVLKVSEVDESGNATATFTIERSWGESESEQTGHVTFDSADEGTEIPRMVYGSRAGSGWTVTIRPDATFAEIEALLSLQTKGTGEGAARDDVSELGAQWNAFEGLRQLSLLVPRLPGGKMPAGTFYEDAAPCGTQGRWSFRLERRSELARKSDEEVVIKAGGRMTDLAEPRSAKARKERRKRSNRELKKASFAGAYLVSRVDGLPLTSEVDMVIAMAVDFGDDGKGSSTETVSLALRRVVE